MIPTEYDSVEHRIYGSHSRLCIFPFLLSALILTSYRHNHCKINRRKMQVMKNSTTPLRYGLDFACLNINSPIRNFRL